MTKNLLSRDRKSPCELCDGREFESAGKFDRKGNPLDTVVCRRCGLVSHAVIPSEGQLADYYRDTYRKEYNREFSPSEYRVVREWNRGKKIVAALKDFLPQGARLMEVGSGIGCNVKNFELAGYASEGIEPGEGFCRYSQQQLRANVKLASLEDLPQHPTYDGVLLVHVLEHLNKPTASLSHIHSMLHPEGLLYVEVPNFGAPHAAPKKCFHFAHIYNFNEATLTMLGNAAGFAVEQILSKPRDKNLRILFRARSKQPGKILPRGYEMTLAALQRYNTATYHLRLSYLRERIRSLWKHHRERADAKAQLNSILQACQNAPADGTAQYAA